MKESFIRNLAVLNKELKTRMRGRRAAVTITVYLLIITIIGAVMLYIQQQQFHYSYNVSYAAELGAQLFSVLSIFQLVLVVFIVPGLTGSAIAGERDHQTLDLLLGTQVSSLGIVLGKILSSLSYVFMLLIAALPVFSLAFLFGGVSPRQVGLSFVVALASALTLGTVSVFFSVAVRRGNIATVIAYSVAFLLVVGTIITTAFIQAGTQGSLANNTAVLWPLVFNPLAAQASTLSGIIPTELQMIGGSAANPGSGMPLWQANLIADAFLVALFLWLSTWLLRPARRFRAKPEAMPATEVTT